MNRKILLPVVTPRNALREAIDRALKPTKTELQKKADDYANQAFDELCLDVKRLEHLDKGLILFLYSEFSITKIREFHSGLFKIENYQTTRCSPKRNYRTVADDLNEQWAEEHRTKTQTNPNKVIKLAKNMSYNW